MKNSAAKELTTGTKTFGGKMALYKMCKTLKHIILILSDHKLGENVP